MAQWRTDSGRDRVAARSGGALILLAALVFHAPAAWACPVDQAQVNRAAAVAEQAYAQRDAAGFRSGYGDLKQQLDCVEEPLQPDTAARVHLVEAMASYMAMDEDQAQASFRGALAADPQFLLSKAIAPEGNRLQDLFAAGRTLGPGDTTQASLAKGDVLWVDGHATRRRPVERPAVLQVMEADGTPRGSAYWRPSDGEPTWLEPLRSASQKKKRIRMDNWMISSIGMAAVSSGLWLGYGVDRTNYLGRSRDAQDWVDEEPNQLDELQGRLDRHRDRVNGVGTAAIFGTVAAAGLFWASIAL